MNTSEQNKPIFPKGDPAIAEYFTGQAWVKMLVPTGTSLNTSVANVVFEPGCRNNWHTHPGGQILVATHGIGYYQEKGKPVQLLQPGDVVQIFPEVLHWHGATPDGEFTHIAIGTNTQLGVVNWLQPVTDEEYSGLRSAK